MLIVRAFWHDVSRKLNEVQSAGRIAGIKQTYKEELMRTRVWHSMVWCTRKSRDLNNGWADKTAPAIYRQWASPSSRFSLRFFLPSTIIRHVSS